MSLRADSRKVHGERYEFGRKLVTRKITKRVYSLGACSAFRETCEQIYRSMRFLVSTSPILSYFCYRPRFVKRMRILWTLEGKRVPMKRAKSLRCDLMSPKFLKQPERIEVARYFDGVRLSDQRMLAHLLATINALYRFQIVENKVRIVLVEDADVCPGLKLFFGTTMNDTTVPMEKIQVIHRFRSMNWQLPEHFRMRLTQWTLSCECPVNVDCSCCQRCQCGKIVNQLVHSVDVRQVTLLFQWGRSKGGKRIWYKLAWPSGWEQQTLRIDLKEQEDMDQDGLFKKTYQLVPVFSLIEYTDASIFDDRIVRFITETMAYQTEIRMKGSPVVRDDHASFSHVYGYEWCSQGRHLMPYHRLHAIGVSLISRMGRFGDA